MIRFVAIPVTLCLAGVALGSDYELRLYRVDMPVADEVRSVLDQHLSKPLDTLVPELDGVPLGRLHPLAIIDQDDWDGTDLTGLPGVSGDQNPVPMSQGAAFYSGTEIPYEYLEPRPDGRFDRNIGYVDRGIRLTLKPENPQCTRIWMTLARPGPRQPIDGVTLDVGPVTQGEGPVWTNLVMNTPIGQWSAVLFATREELEEPPRLLLLFLRQLREANETQSHPVSESLVPPIQFSVEAKFLRLPYEPIAESIFIQKNGERITLRDTLLIRDPNAVPVAGEGQRITAIKLPDSEEPIPVNDFDFNWDRLRSAFPNGGLELLSAPRVTTMAGFTDRENPSGTLFKIVLPNGSDPFGLTFAKHQFGGPGFGSPGLGGGGFGGGSDGPGQDAPVPKIDFLSFCDKFSPLVGDVLRSKDPGKPAIIADYLTQKIKVADETGTLLDAEEVQTGIAVALKISCTSAGENILLDIALVETYLDRPPAIKLTRKGSPARPNPIEYTVPDESAVPRRIERSCRFRQPVEDGETLAYLMHDDVRGDLTLVFVTIDRIEGDAAFFYTEPNP